MPTHIYHFTDINNLISIHRDGLRCDNDLEEGQYINSGNTAIKERRKHLSVTDDTFVADYSPFYFAPRSPMLYTQHINEVINQRDIVYLETTVERILSKPDRYSWCFSNMNAAKNMATFYFDAKQIPEIIDFQLMQSIVWNNTDAEPDRMDRRMAEFLVKGNVDWDDFSTIGVFDEEMIPVVTELISPSTTPIVVRRNWYY